MLSPIPQRSIRTLSHVSNDGNQDSSPFQLQPEPAGTGPVPDSDRYRGNSPRASLDVLFKALSNLERDTESFRVIKIGYYWEHWAGP